MSFWPFFGSSRGANLVLTVGSSQVNAAVFRLVNEKPEILTAAKSDIVLGENLDLKRFMISTRNAIEETLKKIQQLSPRPRKVYCILASPWYVAQTRLVNFEAQKPFVVNQQIFQSIINQEVQNFQDEQRRSHSVILGLENKVIEAQNMRILLNGYETGRPLGKKVSKLSLSIFVSLTSEQIIQFFSETVHKFFHHLRSEITFHTLPLATFNVIRRYSPANHNFLLCEIGGGITDVLVAHRDLIEEVSSFPLGENFLYQGISGRFATLPKEAVSLARSYLDGALSGSENAKMTEAIQHVKNEWLKSFQKVLGLSSLEYLLPAKCFILVSASAGPFFKMFVADQSIASFTSENKPFKAELFDQEFLKSFYLYRRGGQFDVYQIIPMLFAAGLN